MPMEKSGSQALASQLEGMDRERVAGLAALGFQIEVFHSYHSVGQRPLPTADGHVDQCLRMPRKLRHSLPRGDLGRSGRCVERRHHQRHSRCSWHGSREWQQSNLYIPGRGQALRAAQGRQPLRACHEKGQGLCPPPANSRVIIRHQSAVPATPAARVPP